MRHRGNCSGRLAPSRSEGDLAIEHRRCCFGQQLVRPAGRRDRDSARGVTADSRAAAVLVAWTIEDRDAKVGHCGDSRLQDRPTSGALHRICPLHRNSAGCNAIGFGRPCPRNRRAKP